MENRNLYLTYKKDTSRLLYWVINTSNGIIRSEKKVGDCTSVTINTTGKSTVSEILSMSKFIAKHVQPIPSEIFRLFRAVIRARSTVYDVFKKMLDEKPDPEIARGNTTHKYFIDALTEAFTALGGNQWDSNDSGENENSQDADDSAWQNHFHVLSLDGEHDDSDGAAMSEDDSHQPQPKQRKNKPSTRGKKAKRAKKRKQASKPTIETAHANIPIESYRIIDGEDGLMSDYLLAVYAVVQEWSALRASVQALWREVAYDGLNGAVAASLTNIAVAMVKKTCIAVFADFPGHESYETIIKTLTRGNWDKAQGQFSMDLYRISTDGHGMEKVKGTSVDVKEQLWMSTYDDLIQFVTDFQKNRNGKPTKAMQAQINDWNPKLDLQRATKEERLRWRRSYTINWLYDLVNLFSSIVVQRNTLKGERHVYEDVDWSTAGPWNHHRRLFGINEFAGVITTLAMQKPNTDIRQKILPHHVFQLQCIVDSLTVTRGWMLCPLRGHMLDRPARKFYPRRDVDLFLDREVKSLGRGFLQSVEILKQLFQKDAEQQHDPRRHQEVTEILDGITYDFVNFLGESKYMYGLKTIPPSRFSSHNANGLWEFSPLLCAAGLVEGLVLAQRVSMLIWDRIPEPTLALHLHNMLVKKGYLKSPVGLYASLETLFQDSFFPEGVPDSAFYDNLVKHRKHNSGITAHQRRASKSDDNQDIHRLLDVRLNRFFNTKTALMMYYDADWDPERIPDSEVTIPSVLYILRLGATKRVIDPLTGEKRLEETALVKRAGVRSQSDAAFFEGVKQSKASDKPLEIDAFGRRMLELKEYQSGPQLDPYHLTEKKKSDFQGRELLDLLRLDLYADVVGNRPLSSLNYVWITVHIMMLFIELEDRLREVRHPLYVQAYETGTSTMRRGHARVALISAVMANEDDQALKIFAGVFEKLRLGLLACIYWQDLDEEGTGKKPDRDPLEDPVDQCSVM